MPVIVEALTSVSGIYKVPTGAQLLTVRLVAGGGAGANLERAGGAGGDTLFGCYKARGGKGGVSGGGGEAGAIEEYSITTPSTEYVYWVGRGGDGPASSGYNGIIVVEAHLGE